MQSTTETVTDTTSPETTQATPDATPIDNTNDDTGVAQNETSVALDTLPQSTIEQLVNESFEDYSEFSDNTNHTGMRPLHELLKHLPEDARKHVANLRSSYTTKTQELAQLRADINAEREALLKERKALYEGDFADNVNKLAQEPETPHDVWTEEGIQSRIQQEAAKMFQQMLNPLQEQIQLDKRQNDLARFKETNPDLMTDEYRMPVARLLQSRPELRLEDAYYIIKAQRQNDLESQLVRERDELRSRRQEALLKTSTGSNSRGNGTPKFKDAWSAFQYHKNNANKN